MMEMIVTKKRINAITSMAQGVSPENSNPCGLFRACKATSQSTRPSGYRIKKRIQRTGPRMIPYPPGPSPINIPRALNDPGLNMEVMKAVRANMHVTEYSNTDATPLN